MSKIGVGVGEDFPVDEDNSSPHEGKGCCGHRHAARHQAWRRFRHQMHAEWHAKRRAMRDAMHRQDGAQVVDDLRERHLHHLILGGLAVVGLAALLGHLHRD